jgi:hypothetical protein
MNYTKIEKAAKVYEKIKKLDAEIIALEKMANKIAEGDKEITVLMRVPIAAKEEPKETYCLGDTFSWPLEFDFSTGRTRRSGATTVITHDEWSSEIDETAAFHMLGYFLAAKQRKRESLLKQIQELMQAV